MGLSQLIADRFEIADTGRDLLGRGGMGDVYRGTDTATGQLVAIKELKPETVANASELVSRFVREGEALRRLNHPNIVKMVAAVEQEGRYFLVMEYVEGGSLRDLLEEQGRLSIGHTIELSLDLADALTRAHRLGIIHRDLKPANVLLAQDGTPRLTDFGIAQVKGSPRLTQTGILIGTLDYLSPEACSDETLDSRTDIWSFGVMLYEMLTGKRPFAGPSVAAKLAAILQQPVPDLAQLRPEIPDALVDLIFRMLEKDRHQRIPSVRLVGAELEAILEDREPISSTPRAVPAALPTLGRFVTSASSQTAGRRHNLPAQATPFVGREAELTELERLLSTPDLRLLTILGPGGMGKTRLALEAGAAQLDRFTDGVYLVSLAPIQAVEAIVPTVADAVSFSFFNGVEPRQQLLDYLRQKHMLLLMDNYEHVLEGVSVVSDILAAAPQVKILTTSRARLNLQGEQLFQLSGMDFPEWETPEDAAQYSAVKLFLQSARRVRPDFELIADDLKYVSRICRLVQGMPLGILLAAAWVELLTPAEIASEISQSLDFLETDMRDLPERQRSIRAVFDYSWSLLNEREKEVFPALSVFCGGFTRQAAQQVTAITLRELMALVNKALLYRMPTGRYEVHELLRQYAAEKLAQSAATEEAVRDRHSTYYIAALQRWDTEQRGSRQQRALEEMDKEIENARAAWNRAVARGSVVRLDQGMDGLCRYYAARGRFQEGEQACQAAADKLAREELTTKEPGPPVHDRLRVGARALVWQGVFCTILAQNERAEQLLQQSEALLDRPALADQDVRSERAFLLTQQGALAFRSDIEKARQLNQQSLALYQELEDSWQTANTLAALGGISWLLSAYDQAKRWGEEGLAIRQELGDQAGIANSLGLLSMIAMDQQRFAEAERLIRESVAIRRELGNPGAIAMGLGDLGGALLWLGKFAEAHTLLEECLVIYQELGARLGEAHYRTMLGRVEAHLGRYEEARVQAQAGYSLSQEIGYERGMGLGRFGQGSAALAEKAYAEAGQLLQESVTIYQGIGRLDELTWARFLLGLAAHRLHDIPQARLHLSAALQMAAEIQVFKPLMFALPAMALFLADQGEKETALELYALASRYPFVANSRLLEDIAGRHIAAIAATLPADVVTAAQARGQARHLEGIAEELLARLGHLPAL